MDLPHLTRVAEQVVADAQRALPKALRGYARELPVLYHDRPSDEILGGEFEADILGMFAGSPHGHDTGDRNDVPAQMMLFLGNLWEFAEADESVFREEVRVTYLHELGHYFGWDEDDLEVRGLG